jgi:hypothetical protein
MKRTLDSSTTTANNKRRTNAKRTFAPRAQTLTAAQRKAMAAIANKAVARRQEVKYAGGTTNYVAVGLAIAPYVRPLTEIPQGDNEDERVGDDLYPKYFAMRYSLKGRAGSNDVVQVRVLIVQWYTNTANGGNPDMNQVINQNRAFSFYDPSRLGQFKVLHDAKYLISPHTDSPNNQVMADVYIPGSKMKGMRFNDSSTNGANKLFLMTTSDEDSVNLIPPMIKTDYRLAYTDS